jgi:hypothetical protein
MTPGQRLQRAIECSITVIAFSNSVPVGQLQPSDAQTFLIEERKRLGRDLFQKVYGEPLVPQCTR